MRPDSGGVPSRDVLDPDIHAAYQRRRQLRKIGILGFVALWLVVVLSALIGRGRVPAWVDGFWMLGMAAFIQEEPVLRTLFSMLSMAAFFLLAAFSWRCPRCGYFIAGQFSRARYCWKCGVRLS